MNRFILLFLCVFVTATISAQNNINPFWRFTDFHIHPTYKHYFRPKTADSMKLILDSTKYDPVGDTFTFNPEVKKLFENVNWTKYDKTNAEAVANGLTSNLRNYDQASYPEIMYTPGSLLTNSFSPYEKQFVLKESKREISSKFVTGMGLSRLEAYAEDDHTPFRDFLAEYFFSLMQEEEKFIETQSPEFLYRSIGNTFVKEGYYNKIKLVKDSLELSKILEYNNSLFNATETPAKPFRFITPMVMSIEGAQILYGPLSGNEKYILNPLNFSDSSNINFTYADDSIIVKIHSELLKNVDSLRNLPHRLFFITPAHFAQNHVVGFAKTLDRDPENFQHRTLAFILKSPRLRNDFLRKTYAGFNHYKGIGLRVVKAFLDPSLAKKYKKPTYIDVKHMDIKARIQYYYERRKYEKEFGVKIPIIASHFGVSGENQAMAAATGLWPNFDRYNEIDNTEKYYRRHILKNENINRREHYWKESMMNIKGYPSRKKPLDSLERAMYKPLNFLDDSLLLRTDTYDPFVNYKLDSNKNAGWYYPWSLNLFDEEIIEINKSDGIIGLLLDPRQLGAYMKKYDKKYFKNLKRKFNVIKDTLSCETIAKYGLRKEDLNEIEYCKSEPLLRNMFYIVNLLYKQQHAESINVDSIRNKLYPWFVKDYLKLKKEPWETIAIGSDYDGLIDPFDFAPTASYIPKLHQRLIFYAYIFAIIHNDEFYEPEPMTKVKLIKDINDSEKKMKMFFYENGEKFIKIYF